MVDLLLQSVFFKYYIGIQMGGGVESENYAYIACVADKSAWRNLELRRMEISEDWRKRRKEEFLDTSPYKVKVTLEQATKLQRGSRFIAVYSSFNLGARRG
jgi:hypothetical protein